MREYMLRPRSTSMDRIHRRDGGISSRARIEVDGDVIYSNSFNTRNRPATSPPDEFGRDEDRISRNDVEVHVLDEVLGMLKKPLRYLRAESSAADSVRVEYHSNHGPCVDCQRRFVKASERFAEYLPYGSSLESSVYYSAPPSAVERGRQKTWYGYEGDAPAVLYGQKKTNLYIHDLPVREGRWSPRRTGEVSKNVNPFDFSVALKPSNRFTVLAADVEDV